MTPETKNPVRTGWSTRLTRWSLTALILLAVTGLVVTFGPFHAAVEWSVLLHTGLVVLALVPLIWYSVAHWRDDKTYNLSDVLLLGYVSAVALVLCLLSGVVVTWQGLFALRMSPLWKNLHLWSTVVGFATGIPHVLLVVLRDRRGQVESAAGTTGRWTLAATALGVAAMFGLGGVPPTAGFIGKWYILSAAVEATSAVNMG